MAAAIIILFRGKYGWGFPVGSFCPCFFVFNGGFTKQPQPGSSIPLTISAVGVLVSYAGEGQLPFSNVFWLNGFS